MSEPIDPRPLPPGVAERAAADLADHIDRQTAAELVGLMGPNDSLDERIRRIRLAQQELQRRRHVAGKCRSELVPVPDHMPEARAIVEAYCDEAGNPEYARDSAGRPCFRIDECVASALLAVWAAGLKTLGCCCGHGQDAGGIITLDIGTFSAAPRTDTQERFAGLHREAEQP